MTPREERGLVIAALCKLKRTKEGWMVPSQSTGERIYTVDVKSQTCTCLDHVEGKQKCKHLFAVEFTIKREFHDDGSVTETRSVTFTEKKKYTQNWPAYNEAMMTEKHRFQALLCDLCSRIPEPPPGPKGGRPPIPLRDQVFASTFKIYSTVSSRRFACDLDDAHERGYISRPIHCNKVNKFLEDGAVTPILTSMISRSALPLTVIDRDFAVDSSGFTSSKFVRWYDEKYGVTRRRHTWVKVHLACGTKTNIVTAARISEKDSHDYPQFGPLVKTTAENFTIDSVSADKGYLGRENFEIVDRLGGTAFIAFKENTTGGAGGLFEQMFHYYQFRKEEFLTHYHKRSNVESTFSMIKRKFGDHVRSKSEPAMVNEVLGKVLAHNICCVIASQCELGIEPVFWSGEPSDRMVLPLKRNPVG
jgi:transposase